MAPFLNKKQLCGVLLAMSLGAVCAGVLPVSAASFMPLPSTEELNVPAPEGDNAFEKLENLLGPVARNLRIIIGGVAVLLIVMSGFTMVISGENEEKAKEQKKSITYGIIGLMMISLAGPISEIFDYRQGNFMDDPSKFIERAQIFDSTTQIVITFIKYLLGGLATLMFIRAGAVMVVNSENEEDVTQAKKNIALAAGGLMLVMFSNVFIRKVFYVTDYSSTAEETVVALDQNEFVKQLVAITNLMVSFVGPIMMLGIVIGGLLYVTAGGDEERTGLAKKIIMNSIIGVVIIYGAFALVSTVISGQF